ncbi:MAG: T9SS type A sorting domain-containing protein [candidate division KSB1 bacterium]|nr:T9SS type A sorting domain-containing protein [candidate division KSB1 bacterium]
MKKLLLLSAVLMLVISNQLVFSQTQSKGDTLIIGPLNSEGQPIGALNEAIKKDVDASGNRLHKVYKLERNAQYILTDVIQADFPLVIVADKPDPANRPPVIRCGLKADGSTVNNWWNLYNHATFKNLWLTGINMDGTGPISWVAQIVNTSGKTITFEGCIIEFPYTWWATFADWGRNVYRITNCIFKNIGNPTGVTWNGAIFNPPAIDSAFIRNTTFFNFGCFAVTGGPGTFYTEVDHCTFVNSMVHPIESHNHVIKKFTNNLFVNCHAFSDDYDEIKRHFDQEVKGLMNYAEIQWDPQRLDSLFGPKGIYGKKYDPNGDGKLTEDELVWVLKNNAWWYTQPIKDYWAQFSGTVVPNPWMNNYNKAMFENQSGPWEWTVKSYIRDTAKVIIDSTYITMKHQPFRFFKEENTMNVDPGIKDMNGCDVLLAQNCINIRTSWAGGTVTNPVKWHNVADYLEFTWPLDFDLSYTNETLKTAGTDGKPVGSLQWWPGIEYVPSEVATKPTAIPADFTLSQNYPNPFNPTTAITYSLNKKANVELKVYNVLGSEVATLVNEMKNAGTYTIQFDASNLTSGVYFYQLKSGDKTITRKMMLMK